MNCGQWLVVGFVVIAVAALCIGVYSALRAITDDEDNNWPDDWPKNTRTRC